MIALIHAIGEMIIVIPFYYGNGMDIQMFCYMIFGLVGLELLFTALLIFVSLFLYGRL